MHLNVTILQHKLGKAALACRKMVAGPGGGGSRILFKEAHESDQCCVAAPRNTSLYTTRYTTRNTTELLAGAAFWSFEAFKEWNENTSQFFCPDRKCCPWERFGSVACSLACSAACGVAWGLRVVCSVACGSCHVAYFASCSALCAGGEWGNSFSFFGGWKKSCTTSITLHLLMHNLYPRTPKLTVEWHVNRWWISVTRTNPLWSLCLQSIIT